MVYTVCKKEQRKNRKRGQSENMKYEHITEGRFIDRPNRFIAHVEINGQVETVHVKNTGRCRELLIPGVQVFLEKSSNPARKTAYDLICVNKKGRGLINMDSQIPNKAALEWVKAGHLFPEKVQVTPEKTYGNSRFDLYVCSEKRKAFIEVKGVTLESDNIARFPDAPTERGVKHLKELIHCMQEGYEAYLLLVIQMKGVDRFEPNWETHREFGETLQEAKKAGVHILAYDCLVEPDRMEIQDPVPVCLAFDRKVRENKMYYSENHGFFYILCCADDSDSFQLYGFYALAVWNRRI